MHGLHFPIVQDESALLIGLERKAARPSGSAYRIASAANVHLPLPCSSSNTVIVQYPVCRWTLAAAAHGNSICRPTSQANLPCLSDCPIVPIAETLSRQKDLDCGQERLACITLGEYWP